MVTSGVCSLVCMPHFCARYFTHDGVILFKKEGAGPWKPYSFFANRIANNQPGSWFKLSDPIEDTFFATISETGHGAGWNAENIAAAGKAAELMNDGSTVRW